MNGFQSSYLLHCIQSAGSTSNYLALGMRGLSLDHIDMYGTGKTTFPQTTDSTSTTTGAVVVSGGLGVAKTLYANSIYSNGIINATGINTNTTYCQITNSVGNGGGLAYLMPNLPTGSNSAIYYGLAQSNYNTEYIYYHNVGVGSTSNYINIGMWGLSPDPITFNGSGIVSIQTTTESTSTTTESQAEWE